MTHDNLSQPSGTSPRRTPLDIPRFMATVIVTGLGTLFVVGFFLFPQLGEGREEWRHRCNSRLCRQAQSELAALPPEQRLTGHEVLGRVPPNLVIMEMPKTEERNVPVRAALTEPDFRIVHTFVPKDINSPLSNGRSDYTIENAEVYLAQIKVDRRRQWITFLSVWLAAWVSFSWHLLAPKEIKHEGTSDFESESPVD